MTARKSEDKRVSLAIAPPSSAVERARVRVKKGGGKTTTTTTEMLGWGKRDGANRGGRRAVTGGERDA